MRNSAATTSARAVPDTAFKACCRNSGRYDGAGRDYYFQGVTQPCSRLTGAGERCLSRFPCACSLPISVSGRADMDTASEAPGLAEAHAHGDGRISLLDSAGQRHEVCCPLYRRRSQREWNSRHVGNGLPRRRCESGWNGVQCSEATGRDQADRPCRQHCTREGVRQQASGRTAPRLRPDAENLNAFREGWLEGRVPRAGESQTR